jgi:hypothetical protein
MTSDGTPASDDAVIAAQAAANEAADTAARLQAAANEALEKAQQAAAEAAAQAEAAQAAATAASSPAASASASSASSAGPLTDDQIGTIRSGYAFDGTAIEMGALVNGEAHADVPIRIPLAMMNRHGLVAGATGTGKTKTLQVLAEQLAAQGVPVFAADIKGDLSGIASAGVPNEKLLERTNGLGQQWAPVATTTEYFSLGGVGRGVPIRATIAGFGPLLLGVLLRRGAPAVQGRVEGLPRLDHADRAPDPFEGRRDLLRHPDA